MSDPRKNVMSELAQQKSKLMQGQSNPRSQQFSGRVSAFIEIECFNPSLSVNWIGQ